MPCQARTGALSGNIRTNMSMKQGLQLQCLCYVKEIQWIHRATGIFTVLVMDKTMEIIIKLLP